ncbi:hypothetical protein J5N97_018288 [Dioscorea zingiberensis]|uniref:Uncharacterized protein n=1 Tax=Dioscorea zingiberensis TaxID=325984 RepID=A0A9D5HH85_9LILI|nr:hypothetical protein J5N97_018288 [Dioscorea zingiberensis]
MSQARRAEAQPMENHDQILEGLGAEENSGTWKIAGHRYGRGRGRGPPANNRKKEGSTVPRNRPVGFGRVTARPGSGCVSGRPLAWRMRGGSFTGRPFQSRGNTVVINQRSNEGDWPPLNNPKFALSSPPEDPSSSSAMVSYQPPVEPSPVMEPYQQAPGPSLLHHLRKSSREDDLEVGNNREIGLITSADRMPGGRRHQHQNTEPRGFLKSKDFE